jgi:hypothetical protein
MGFLKGGRRKEEKLNERKEKLVVTHSVIVKSNRIIWNRTLHYSHLRK